MNIYDMLKWIREWDSSEGKYLIHIGDFLLDQHISGNISSEKLFYFYKDLMIIVINKLNFTTSEFIMEGDE